MKLPTKPSFEESSLNETELNTGCKIPLPDELLYQILSKTDLYTMWVMCRQIGWDEKYLLSGLELFKEELSAEWAADNGHFELDFWKFLDEKNGSLFISSYYEPLGSFIAHSSLELLEFMFSKQRILLSEASFSAAAKHGDIVKLKWLLNKGCALGEWTFMSAVEHGNLENMKWLRENECPWGSLTFMSASKHGNLTNMKWLRKGGCPWDDSTMTAAAAYGNLENLKWLRANRCPWVAETFKSAAKFGSLENMMWLQKNRCPWEQYVFEETALLGNLNHMKWLREKRCPWSKYTFSAAAENGSLVNMQWLQTNGCPWDKIAFKCAARNIAYDCSVDSSNLDKIPLGDYQAILLWLQDIGHPWNRSATYVYGNIIMKGQGDESGW